LRLERMFPAQTAGMKFARVTIEPFRGAVAADGLWCRFRGVARRRPPG
jgi:hypothetical protein